MTLTVKGCILYGSVEIEQLNETNKQSLTRDKIMGAEISYQYRGFDLWVGAGGPSKGDAYTCVVGEILFPGHWLRTEEEWKKWNRIESGEQEGMTDEEMGEFEDYMLNVYVKIFEKEIALKDADSEEEWHEMLEKMRKEMEERINQIHVRMSIHDK